MYFTIIETLNYAKELADQNQIIMEAQRRKEDAHNLRGLSSAADTVKL